MSILQQDLAAVQPWLCLDNIEIFAATDAAFWSLLEAALSVPGITMLLMSRQRPALKHLGDYPLLTGLAPDEVKLLVRQHSLTLDAAQVADLTTYTGGNPRLLELSLAYLRSHLCRTARQDFTAVLGQLAGLPSVAHYLVTETLDALSEREHAAAQLLTLARRPLDGFALRDPPEAWPLENINVTADDFAGLEKRGLIHVDLGAQWTLTPLLSDYLKQRPPTRHAAFHNILAQLYTLQGDTLETAYHQAQSGQMDAAVNHLAGDWDALLRRGQAAAMLTVLQVGTPDKTDVQQVWRDLKTALLRLLGQYAAADAVAAEMEPTAASDIARAHALHVRAHPRRPSRCLWLP